VVGKDKYGNHGRGQIIGDTEGMIKMIFEVPSGKLLGVHVIGELASELIHVGLACLSFVGLACLSFGGDIDFFIHTVFNYPTLSDVYKYAAYNALGKLNKAREAAGKHDGRGNLALIDWQSAPLLVAKDVIGRGRDDRDRYRKEGSGGQAEGAMRH